MKKVKIVFLNETFNLKVDEEFWNFLEKRGGLEGLNRSEKVLNRLLELEGELFEVEKEVKKLRAKIEKLIKN
jgi:hypothetical protein